MTNSSLKTANKATRAEATVVVAVKLDSLIKNEAAILVGDVFSTEDGIKFICIEDVELNSFITNYPVRTLCIVPGIVGNVEANTIIQVSRPYYESVTNPHPAWGGLDS